jgi:hypothetical protein
VSDANLTILHFDRGTSTWITKTRLGNDPDLNWVSTSIEEDGIYAVGWITSSTVITQPRHVFIPLLKKP